LKSYGHFDDTAFLRSPRFAELAAALRRRAAGAVNWFPPELFPFKNGKRHV
jgi:hypothetical protein